MRQPPPRIGDGGARVKGDPESWENVLHRLRHADLEKIQQQFPDYPYRNLLKAIQMSVDWLETDQLRERYLEFAVFPEDTPIPEAVLHTFWAPFGMDKYDVQDAIKQFADLSLVRRDNKNRLNLHDLQYDYTRKQNQAQGLCMLHKRLIDAYGAQCKDDWPTGPHDGYYFEHLAWHLKAAERTADLKQLLYNFEWLQAKLGATDIHTLIADYDYLPEDKDLRTIQSVLRHSAHILAGSPRELPGQLIGRLPVSLTPGIDALRNQTSEHRGFPWLRPLGPSLTPPDASLVRILKGHISSVSPVTVTPDGRVVSSSWDKTLRVWDLATGDTKTRLQGHALDMEVHAVAVTADGRHVVSGSDRGTLCVWDLATGETKTRLQGHTGAVYAVAVTPDGCHVVSGSADMTLRVWDLATGETKTPLHGHTSRVSAVAVTPDGRHVVSGSADSTLRVWNLKDGKEILTFTVDGEVTACIVARDNRTFVAGDGFGRMHFLRLVEADENKICNRR
jgi:hypothetical protein